MENGKWKEAPKKKRNPSANLDVPRAFLCNREEGQKTLDLSKSNISSLPPTLKELSHLTELYLYSNRFATFTKIELEHQKCNFVHTCRFYRFKKNFTKFF